MNVSIAIIIPSLNSPMIDRVLASVENQCGDDILAEILVVGKDDMKLIPPGSRARLIDTGQPVYPGAARNIGIEASNADLLIFLDSDCLPQPGWLIEHIAGHKAGHAVISGGVLPAGDNYWQLSYNLAMFHDYLSTNDPGYRQFLPTLNLSIERRILDRVGLMDENLRRGQDIEWTTRMRRNGFPSYFWPQASVYHDHRRSTMADVWLDCARSGYYSRQIRLRHQDILVAPFLLRFRGLILFLGPFIAVVTTVRIILQRLSIFGRNLETIPALFMAKLAWTWGASRNTEPGT